MLDNGGPPRQLMGAAAGWRAVTRVLRNSAAAAGGAAKTFHADLLNTFFPSNCRTCGLPMLTASYVLVCETCVAGIAAQSGDLCSRCGEALGMESLRFARSMGITECTMCRLAPPQYERAVAFADYDGETREMLHLLKFASMRATAEHVLGKRLADAITKLQGQLPSDIVAIPVPLFAARQAQRGFNQSELLARAAVKHLARTSFPCRLRLATDILVRIKATPPFFSLSPTQRRSRIRGAFTVANVDAIVGREVLLIDDIMTTGATASECARVLRRAGASRVWVATVARAQREGAATHFTEVDIWDTSRTAAVS